MTTSRSLVLFAAVGLLAACSGVRQPILPSSNAALPAQNVRTSGTLVVRVRLQRPETVPNFVSPSTKGLTVDIVGPTNVKKTVGLTLTANGCKSTMMTMECTLVVPRLKACPSKKPCYTATITTYDAFSNGKIPKSARALSADDFTFTIGGGATTIPIVLQGIPKNVLVSPAVTSSLTGSESSGFVEPKCSASVQKIHVVSLDPDGNFIVGPGAPNISLRSSNSSQFAVRHPSTNLFTLSPPKAPKYPFGNVKVTLTAKAVPSKASGARSVAQSVRIAYSGDICGVIDEFDVPSGSSSSPRGITAGSDGALWFAEQGGDKIGRASISGTITEFGGLTANAAPFLITSGSDHNLWFTEFNISKIGRMTTAGTLTEFPTLSASAEPYGITAGPDGNLWFGEIAIDKIGVMTTAGAPSEFSVPTSNAVPTFITPGPDGALWFSETSSGKIGRVTTAGDFEETTIPTAGAFPFGIVAGADGQVWFGEFSGNKIGRIRPAALPSINSEFPFPSSNGQPFGAAAGPDGNVWLAEQTGDRIASITPDGKITEYTVPTANSAPSGIAAGPDGAIWFTELNAGKIGRLR